MSGLRVGVTSGCWTRYSVFGSMGRKLQKLPFFLCWLRPAFCTILTPFVQHSIDMFQQDHTAVGAELEDDLLVNFVEEFIFVFSGNLR